MSLTLRELTSNDLDIHKEFIYVALWDAPEDQRRPRSVLESGVVKAYYENWGKKYDLGYIALKEHTPVGFIQIRIKESITREFGDLPELVISVLPNYRNKGVANKLMNMIIKKAKVDHAGIRLGVNPKNHAAIKLYENFGFKCYAHPEHGYPQMVLRFDGIYIAT